ELRFLQEEGGGDVAGGAGARVREVERTLAHMRDQLAERVRRQRLAPDEHQRIAVDEAYRRQIALGGVGQLRPLEPELRRNLRVVQEQRVAVGRRARDA